jgi:hypothetical protein
MDNAHDDEGEAARDTSMIEGLAKSKGVRLEEVRRLYELALEKMKQKAVIFDFLPIFAARHVREVLEKEGEPGRSGEPVSGEEQR